MSEMNENTIASVEQLLTKYELLVYSSAFQEQGYDSLSQLQSITEIELQELITAVGMVAGHVARLRRAVNLPSQAAAPPAPPSTSVWHAAQLHEESTKLGLHCQCSQPGALQRRQR